ncbi:MAG TPA: hypothetical protein VGI47_06960, partial [Candidatus Binataceae bacterium]
MNRVYAVAIFFGVLAPSFSSARASDLSVKLTSFVQKRFLIPNAQEITIGPPTATPIAGLTKYLATVTTP